MCAAIFGIYFEPSSYEMLSQDPIGAKPDPVYEERDLDASDRLNCLGSYTAPNGRISDEASSRIKKARLTLTNLGHLWHPRDTWL